MKNIQDQLVVCLRQYRHNDNSDFVTGYDKDGVDRVVSSLQEENKRLLFANRYSADMYRQIDDERKLLQAEVERLRARNDDLLFECNQAGDAIATLNEANMRERSNSAKLREKWLDAKDDIETTEQERDQLKASVSLAIDTFRRYEMDVETYPTINHIKMMRNLNGALAKHDAEVIERARAYVTSEISSDSPCEDYDSALGEYANQLRQQAKEHHQ